MESAWDNWKKGFDVWEKATAGLLETMMKSPLLLEPTGTLLTQMMKLKAASDRAVEAQSATALGAPGQSAAHPGAGAVHAALDARRMAYGDRYRLDDDAAGPHARRYRYRT